MLRMSPFRNVSCSDPKGMNGRRPSKLDPQASPPQRRQGRHEPETAAWRRTRPRRPGMSHRKASLNRRRKRVSTTSEVGASGVRCVVALPPRSRYRAGRLLGDATKPESELARSRRARVSPAPAVRAPGPHESMRVDPRNRKARLVVHARVYVEVLDLEVTDLAIGDEGEPHQLPSGQVARVDAKEWSTERPRARGAARF